MAKNIHLRDLPPFHLPNVIDEDTEYKWVWRGLLPKKLKRIVRRTYSRKIVTADTSIWREVKDTYYERVVDYHLINQEVVEDWN